MHRRNLCILNLILLTILFTAGSGYCQAPKKDWAAQVVSVDGNITIRRAGQTQWKAAGLNAVCRAGDMLHVTANSRAAIVLPNNTTLRLDQKTTLVFSGKTEKKSFLLRLIEGAMRIFSRTRQQLKILTPYANAAIEGTEFLVRVSSTDTLVAVYEGKVSAENALGSVELSQGQAVVATADAAPQVKILARPKDAVFWALYYPVLTTFDPGVVGEASAQDPAVKKAVDQLRNGDVAGALAAVIDRSETDDIGINIFRSTLYLAVGNTDAARRDIGRALDLKPDSGEALALSAIMDIVQGETAKGHATAQKAVEKAPQSAAAHAAMAYAQQARFQLDAALNHQLQVVELAPEDALAWARLAELRLSLGQRADALTAASHAAQLNPNVARTHAVMGFSHLASMQVDKAIGAFKKAVALDSSAPLPRLGLGLATIQKGDLIAGRQILEIAAGLDPHNAIVRSYLGKAYFEEKRNQRAATQFSLARDYDPQDPTPWLYDALLLHSINQPVKALESLQQSIARNDQRAVYRSRFMLDEDLAVRGASMGRIYNELGFEQMALAEGWRSLQAAPDSHAAHRLLADSYRNQPRHEIARVSELLQAQLLQPLNLTPLQPQLADSSQAILDGAGPADPGFNEFTPLFTRNRFGVLSDVVVGSNDTIGNDLVVSGLVDRFSFSAGQYHYESDGYRENNNQTDNIYNVLVQARILPQTTLLAEFRRVEKEYGDLDLRFDPEYFSPNLRYETDTDTIRIGLRQQLSARSTLLVTAAHLTLERRESEAIIMPPIEYSAETEQDGYMVEGQYLQKGDLWRLIAGVGHFQSDSEEQFSLNGMAMEPEEFDDRHTTPYAYAMIDCPLNMSWTLGVSGDFFDDGVTEQEQFNPKVGLNWGLLPGGNLRAAAFRTLKRLLVNDQTLEPTHVAGFNQFYDDGGVVEAWRYGVGYDQRFTSQLSAGVEYSVRDLEVPYFVLRSGESATAGWDEQLLRAYLYWTPASWLATSLEYDFEHFEHADEMAGPEQFTDLKTHRVPIALKLFHHSGLSFLIKATYVDQQGTFGDPRFLGVEDDADRFWIVDAAVKWRLPKRYGTISVEARNLLDEQYQYQETDWKMPLLSPDPWIGAKLTLNF